MKKYLPYFFRLAVFFSLVFSVSFSGQILFSNPITGTNPSTANPYITGQNVAANITVSGIGHGSGITGASANDRYNAAGWSSPTLDADDYFEFTLTPNPNFKIDFTGFIYEAQTSGTGPVSFAFRSSLDNFTSDIGVPTETGATISLRAAAFQNITTSVTFRIYGWGASAAGGTFSINNFTFNGTATSSIIKPEPTDFPSSFSCAASNSSSIQLSWTDATGNSAPDGYLVKWSSTDYADITNPIDGMPEANGTNAQNIGQGVQTFSLSGLPPSTAYYFKIWSYTNSGTDIDYKLIGEPQTSCTTMAPPCNFTEDFENIPNTPSPGQYLPRSWTGSGGTWTAISARTDQTLNGKAIVLDGSGSVAGPTVINGLGNLSFKYVRGFTNSDPRTIQLWVNGMQVGPDIMVNPSSNVIQNYSIDVNLPGNIQFELRTFGAQIKIDDITWTCFTGTAQPNINIQGNGTTIPNGDTTPAANDLTDFGAAIIAGTDVERTFTVQNVGSATLTLEDPAVSLVSGSAGFSVSAQPSASNVLAFSSVTFKIKFNSMIPGGHIGTVQIASDDPDMPLYTFLVAATVAQPLITVDKTSLSGFTYPLAQGPSALQSFKVNGSNLAADITVTASANWEISTNQTYDANNVTPWTSLVLTKTQTGAVTNKTVYVRLKDGLPVGSYSGTVTLTSPSAVSQTVSLAGQVTVGIVEMKVTGNGTTINNGSATASGLNNTLFASQNLGESQTKGFEIKNLGGAPLTLGAITIIGTDATAFSILNGPASGTVLNHNQSVAFQIRFAPTTIGTKNATVSIANNDPNDNPYTFAIRGGAVYCSSPGEIVVAVQDFETTVPPAVMNFTQTNIGSLAPGLGSGFTIGDSGNNSFPKNNKLYSEGSRGYRVQGADPIGETASGLMLIFNDVNTSSYTNLSLSFKIAGFSLGSSSNGMDSKNADSEPELIPDDTKIDHVLVEISPDGGANWYRQAKIVSDQMNLAWSFGSANTAQGSRSYSSDNVLTYFKSTSGSRYSAVTINNLPSVSSLKVRISLQNNAVNESWIIDDIRITSTGLVPKVWNGSSWSPSAPQPSDKVIIAGDYNTAVNGGFTACQCEVSSGATLTVSGVGAVKASDVLVNNGNVIVESDANLVQVNESDSNSGSGLFKAKRKINLSSNRQQYNFLISPALDWNMKDIYKDSAGNPVSVPFILYHNEATNTFANSSGAFIKGRALAVKEPTANFPVSEINAVFEGKPVNGAFVYSLSNSNPNNPKRGFNLIGNPYPSNMDLIKFYQNNTESNTLSPTFYFWDNTANTQIKQMGDQYEGQAYATFNAATPPGEGTPLKATGDPGTATLKEPTRYVKVAQGFMAKLIGASQMDLKFNNNIRSAESAEGFFGKDAADQPDRFWLNMANSSNIASNMAVVYFAGGNNSYTMHDSQSMGGSDVIYSLVDGEKVSINGKSDFTPDDVVALGTSHFAPGNYSISLDRAEGVFAKGQQIYLKDKLNGIVSNLSEGSYIFSAAGGETMSTFEIIYKLATVLASGNNPRDMINVYKSGQDFIVKAKITKITTLELYDAAGRLVHTSHPNSTEASINTMNFSQGLYVLRINQDGLLTSKRMIK